MIGPAELSSLRRELDEPFPLPPGAVEHFRAEGYVKLKHVLSPELLAYYGEAITRQVVRLNTLNKPMAERSTYERAFLQIMNLWTKDDTCREFSFSRRLARLAAELMGVRGVRMYHDQALYKEAGGGITPWHADQYYWPLSNNHTCTVWVPFQDTPVEMGPLAFAARSHRFEHGRDLEISDESEARLQKMLASLKFRYVEEPYELGEISYHYGWTFHRAGGNSSDRPRAVMTVIYMEDGIRLIKPTNKHHRPDWEAWLPGCQIGEIANSRLNPVLWSESVGCLPN
ncbi:MAG TPA: phytanoyl-CoA dioxygenase family protein [Terrimicrobiaceae bacterium]|nr:phytanoyl-CoA dioxygenase family protein [Terrimicrobiaceae bacterium]